MKYAITRLFRFEGYEPFRRYMEIYEDPCGCVMHRWIEERINVTLFNSPKAALNMMTKHVPLRNQHKCEVIPKEVVV